MFLRLAAIGLALLTVGAITIKLHHHHPMAYAADLFDQPVSASEPIRIQQAQEFDAYLKSMRAAAPDRAAVFQPDFSSTAAFEESKRDLTDALKNSIGYPPPGKCSTEPPTFTLIGEDRQAKYYRASIPVLEGLHSVGLFITPVAPSGKHPLIIAIHGAKGSPDVATFEGGANYRDLVRGAVAHGYAVWAPQHLFLAEGFAPDLRQQTDARARLVGTTVFGLEIAKLHRALDVILERPEVDANRVAVVGHSYGGLYALISAALDPRIKAVVASCFFGATEDKFDGSPASGAPDLLFMHGQTMFRAPELAALVCPRPLYVQMGRKDTIVNIDTARRLVPEAQTYFQKLGKTADFAYTETDGAHEFHGEPAWEFLRTRL